ncbi:MAG TPA: prephenate dehydrogenase/arogenate dehydrogenase family protein, partial [Arenibaculum sp.]|nr:prephenate dehydrogenase/arogenate dehydrogenase family protein [Arenibaculum sp.]
MAEPDEGFRHEGFRRVALIGIGLIGSSIACAVRRHKLAGEIVCSARTEATRAKALELGLVDRAVADSAEAVDGADLVVLCSPVGTYGDIAARIADGLAPG